MGVAVAAKEDLIMERKIVSISSKRQITIPQKFFNALGFANEAECVIRGNELILRPARIPANDDFSEFILADLIADGFGGTELLDEFKRRQLQMRSAIEAITIDAEAAALDRSEYFTYEDVFESEDE